MDNNPFARPPVPPPQCPEHGRLVLDLLRGRLEDELAAAAEVARRDCAACHAWWERCFGSEDFAAVDAAAAEVFSRFGATRHRRPVRWIAAAAVFLGLTLGVLALFFQGGSAPRTESQEAAELIFAEAAEVIFAAGFESGVTPESLQIAIEPADAGQPGATEAIFAADFEAGDLGPWSADGS